MPSLHRRFDCRYSNIHYNLNCFLQGYSTTTDLNRLGILVVYLLIKKITKQWKIAVLATLLWGLSSQYEFGYIYRESGTMSQEFATFFLLLSIYYGLDFISSNRKQSIKLFLMSTSITVNSHPLIGIISLCVLLLLTITVVISRLPSNYIVLLVSSTIIAVIPGALYTILSVYNGNILPYHRILYDPIVYPTSFGTQLVGLKPLHTIREISIIVGSIIVLSFSLIIQKFIRTDEKNHVSYKNFFILFSLLIVFFNQAGRLGLDYLYVNRLDRILTLCFIGIGSLFLNDILNLLKKNINRIKTDFIIIGIGIVLTSHFILPLEPYNQPIRLAYDETIQNILNIINTYPANDTTIYFQQRLWYDEPKIIFSPEISYVRLEHSAFVDQYTGNYTPTNVYEFIFVEKFEPDFFKSRKYSGKKFISIQNKTRKWAEKYFESHNNMKVFYENENLTVFVINNSGIIPQRVNHSDSTGLILSLDPASETSKIILKIHSPNQHTTKDELFYSINNGMTWSHPIPLIFDSKGNAKLTITGITVQPGTTSLKVKLKSQNISSILEFNTEICNLMIKPSKIKTKIGEQIYAEITLKNNGDIAISPNHLFLGVGSYPKHNPTNEYWIIHKYTPISQKIPVGKTITIRTPYKKTDYEGEYKITSWNRLYHSSGKAFTCSYARVFTQIDVKENLNETDWIKNKIDKIIFILLEIPRQIVYLLSIILLILVPTIAFIVLHQ